MEVISPVGSNTLGFSNELRIELSVIGSGLIVTKVGTSAVCIIHEPVHYKQSLSLATLYQ